MKVYNKKLANIPKDAIYIGRPSKWGNPFSIGKDGTREEVIEKYENWVQTQPQLLEDIKNELCGKDLVCFCSPLKCHGDIIIKLANSLAEFFI